MKDYNIVALSRRKTLKSIYDNVTWREVDLYSISSTENALKGADYAIYLVHSMQPSTRLNQGKFEDTDLLLADNFSRGANANKVEQIIYLGGIIPKDNQQISKHLKSRLEVEKTLASKDVPVTAIRAGIIIGPGGSSFKIIRKLVEKLPVMACPSWTRSLNQPVDVFETIDVIKSCIGNKRFYNNFIEIGGSKIMSYMELLKLTSILMNKKRIIFSVPIITVGISKFWVSIFTGSSLNFVSPLVESLKHKMLPDNSFNDKFFIKRIKIEDSIKNALTNKPPVLPSFKAIKKEKNTVRSVQRISNPSLRDTSWIANQYPIWITKKFAGIINAKFDGRFSF